MTEVLFSGQKLPGMYSPQGNKTSTNCFPGEQYQSYHLLPYPWGECSLTQQTGYVKNMHYPKPLSPFFQNIGEEAKLKNRRYMLCKSKKQEVFFCSVIKIQTFQTSVSHRYILYNRSNSSVNFFPKIPSLNFCLISIKINKKAHHTNFIIPAE